jgi:hypothetical protein
MIRYEYLINYNVYTISLSMDVTFIVEYALLLYSDILFRQPQSHGSYDTPRPIVETSLRRAL